MLVFVNPAGGAGNAKKVWEAGFKLLTLAGYTANVIYTEYQCHC